MKFFIFFFILLSSPVIAKEADLSKVFAKYSVDGAIVITSLKSGNSYVHNDKRANTKFTVASTFKIPNTLIAIQEGIVTAKTDIFKWSGKVYEIETWNKDQTLGSAFQVSCVWCYQEIAEKVGKNAYLKHLSVIGYGDLSKPFKLSRFWLNGSLQLSAIEQAKFLRSLYQENLPFSQKAYNILKDIMRVQQNSEFILYAKTGMAISSKPAVGWYVGYVETKDDVWFFATNIAVRSSSDLPLRKRITLEALESVGAITAIESK